MLTIATLGLLALPALAGITIEKAEVQFPTDSSVTLRVAAVGEGVQVGSYGFRTLEKGLEPLPGFVRRGHYNFLWAGETEDVDGYLLLDNGRGDEDPAEGVFAITVDVSAWPDGEHCFMLYVCNRPAGGPYVHDTRVLQIAVAGGKVVRDKTLFSSELVIAVPQFSAHPSRLKSGEPFDIIARVELEGTRGCLCTLTVPYTVGPDEVPPGFSYNAETKLAYFAAEGRNGIEDNGPHDADPAPRALSVRVPTDGWKPGIYNLTLEFSPVEMPEEVRAYRDFAVTVAPDNPTVETQLEHDRFLRPGTHFSDFCRLRDGSVLAAGYITRDGGITWERLADGSSLPAPLQLRDGTLMGCVFHTEPIQGRPGYFAGKLCRSERAGDRVKVTACEVHVPRATGGIGHAAVKGPLFWRSAVEMPDGTLVAPMYGWFEGDQSPVPGQAGSFYYRTWLVTSADGGEHWEYVSTIGYDPTIGTEGYCEPVLRLLPNGELLCLLRTGGNNRPYHQDNPLCVTRSDDGGKTWQEPQRTGFEGVAPDLVVMADGTLACSTGRPGAWVLFSTDNGHTWGDPVSLDAERYSGYTAICEVEPGVLLVGYGAQSWLDPETGERSDCQRTVRVKVERQVIGDR